MRNSTKLVLMLAALPFIWHVAAEAAAPLGNPFCKNIANPTVLAGLVEDALKKNAEGLEMLDPARCGLARPARPIDYYTMFRIDDPEAGLTTVRDVPRYLRSLEVREAPQAPYLLACLKPDNRSRSGWSAEHNCVPRPPTKGEKVWINPKTNRGGLNSDCSNPRSVEFHVETCGHNFVHLTDKETALRVKEYIRPGELIDDQCSGVKRPGESLYESPWVDECPEALCNFIQVDGALEPLGYKGGRKGSLETVAGTYDFLVPLKAAEARSPYLMAFCTERWLGPSPPPPAKLKDEPTPEEYIAYLRSREEYIGLRERWLLTHSCGTVVRGIDYVTTREGSKVATLYYDEAEARASGTKDTHGEPTQLHWYWQNEEDQCVADRFVAK